MPNRWLIYQKERFPLLGNGVLIFAFSFSAISFSSLLRGETTFPSLHAIVVGFLSAFIFFFQLRIADEFKDNEDDSLFRPYRPVPRGLVKLKELGIIGAAGGVIQFVLALTFSISLIPILLLAWGYFVLMSKEFFLKEWLKAQPLLYMMSHMVIVPMVDYYTSSCDWHIVQANAPNGLFLFLTASYFNGMVIEIGRKIRAPMQEEKGVQTYSSVWGVKKAVIVWLFMMSVTAVTITFAANKINFALPVAVIMAFIFIFASFVGIKLINAKTDKLANLIEPVSGIWTLAIYLSIGVLPLIWNRLPFLQWLL